MIGRRGFITLLGSAAVASPFAGWAQHAARVWRIGFVTHGQTMQLTPPCLNDSGNSDRLRDKTSSLSAATRRAEQRGSRSLRPRWFVSRLTWS